MRSRSSPAEPGDARDARVVFLDVGGTLVEVSPSVGAVYAQACARRGSRVEARDVQHAFDRAWVELSGKVPCGTDRYRLFPGGEREWWQRVSTLAFDLCGVPTACRPSVDELRDVFSKPGSWRVYPEAREALARLRRHGCRVGVISNWDSRLPALLSALELRAHFDEIIYSAATGCEKPNPVIFAAGLAAFHVAPSRAVHVGDRYDEDYQGARTVGLRGLLLDRGGDGNSPSDADEVSRWVDPADRVGDLLEAVDRIMG